MDLDAFALVAELALGLLGFSGVAAAFGGRERAFNYVERTRFLGIVTNSSVPLFGSLSTFIFDSAGWGPSETIWGATWLAVVLWAGGLLTGMPGVTRSGRDESTTTEPWAIAVVWAQILLNAALYAGSLLGGGLAWALIAAYTSHLAMAVFVFWRILMRAD